MSETSAARRRRREVERASLKLARKTASGGKTAGRGRATRGAGTWKKKSRQVALLLKVHGGGRAGDGYSARQEGARMLLTNMLSQSPGAGGREDEFLLDEARHPGVKKISSFILA